MNFFTRLFGQKESKNVAAQQFLESDEVKALVARYRRSAIVLAPSKSEVPISSGDSKFGGIPNLEGFAGYPLCPACSTPLNFVLQLYKKDIPEFYFPEQSNLFQLFRCPNYDCPDASNGKYDLPTLHFYFSSDGRTKEIAYPGHNLKDAEQPVPDCTLHPIVKDDYPNPDDYEEGTMEALEKKFGEELCELYWDTYSAIPHTKIGGYPAFTQFPHYPFCSCGNKKELFFQLSSDDATKEAKFPNFQWSPHGIMIGDVGNIYFFVCRSCGSDTIETYWDCS